MHTESDPGKLAELNTDTDDVEETGRYQYLSKVMKLVDMGAGKIPKLPADPDSTVEDSSGDWTTIDSSSDEEDEWASDNKRKKRQTDPRRMSA